MLDPDLIPSHLIPQEQARPVAIEPLVTPSWTGTTLLLLQLARWVARVMIHRIRRKPLGEEMAREIRSLIERKGGLWVKTGQLLSLRTDLLSPAFSRELSRLQYAAVGFPFEVVRPLVEEELGCPIEAVFSEFQEHPIAAASICQVHRARLRAGGEWVAVKVQRPGIEQRFARDLKILSVLLKGMKHMPGMSFFTWDEMLWETTQIFREEVDYRYEASNTRRLRKSLRAHDVYVPKVYDVSTRRLLVLEWVPGVLMSNFLSMSEEDPARVANWCMENDIDTRKIGEGLFLTFFRQLFEDNLFHGDLHPGNILLLRDSRFALIDFGSAGTNDATLLEYYKMSMMGVGEKDFPMAVDYLFLLSERLPPIDMEAVKERVVRSYQQWSARAELEELPYYDKSIGNMGLEAGNVLIENRVVLSWSFMKISRTWATLDASLAALLPDVNYMNLVAKYFKGAKRRGVRRLRRDGLTDIVGKIHALGLETEMHIEEMRRRLFRVRAELSKGERVVARLLRFGERVGQLTLLALFGLFATLEIDALRAWLHFDEKVAHLLSLVPGDVYLNLELSIAGIAVLLFGLSGLRRNIETQGR